MKKIFALICVICGMFVIPVSADDGSFAEIAVLNQLNVNDGANKSATRVEKQKGCGLRQISLEWIEQYPSDDEFLFSDMTAYNSAPTKNGTYKISGTVWECDNEYCDNDTEITMGPGHVFKGEEIFHRQVYVCKTSSKSNWITVNSHWEPVDEVKLCGETHISYDGIQEPSDNEFLYSHAQAYESVKNRPDGGTVAGGVVYECDNDHCEHNKIQEMPRGHVFNGRVVDEAAKYRCVITSVDDYWERIYEGCQYRGQPIKIGDWYRDSSGTRSVVGFAECEQFHDIDAADADKVFNVKCENVNGEAKLQCYAIGDATQPEKPAKPEKPGDGKTSCRDVRTTENGRACCDTGAAATYHADVDECRCVGGLDFVIENGRGMCVMKQENVGDGTKCDVAMMAQLDKWIAECADRSDIVALINEVKRVCAINPVDRDKFNKLYADLLGKNPHLCAQQDDSPEQITPTEPVVDETVILITTSRKKISDAAKILGEISSGFDVSVWKNEQGKFNTSRLVSDSVAGVVLGTAGGLITSNVVKKNQVENGFEDIQCTIGGQVVADWGDQFRVGIQ